ncbi:unnamed protein product [Ciceribacter sp. T2.26MG-112.2]|uniref:hypothetical protein n=1 Tax=Ciceribacter sp. T2.26MG-112.2 TaxID=3137154 RepID=UPI000E1ABF19|nr:hypothetical protein [Ciceribacter naphthalenivorans]SSC71428.1 unnamed protein product [Ciceribacter naphthalenivorans]
MPKPVSAAVIKSVARITELDKVLIDDVEYIWDCDVPGGKVFIEMAGSHRAVTFLDERIHELLSDDRMIVHQGYHSARMAERRGTIALEHMSMMDEKKLAKAMNRLTWVELYLQVKAVGRGKGPGSDATMEPIMDAVKREFMKKAKLSEKANERKLQYTNAGKFELKAPSASTLRGWLRRYFAADCDISGLIDGHKGDRSTKYTAEERNLHARFVLKYASTTKPSIKHLHRRMVATFNRLNRGRRPQDRLRAISETWLRKKINELPDFYKMAGREGQRKARMYFQAAMRGVDRGVPLQRGEGDEWTMDIHALLAESSVWAELTPKERKAFENVRLTFSGVIDVATKCIFGLRITDGAPSIETAYATLDMTTRDKTFLAEAAGCRCPWEMSGTFRSMGLDSATWFVSEGIKGALLDSGCRSIYPPSGEPYLRGTIERFFRTIASLGLQEFSGQTFSNVVEKGDGKPEEEASVRKDLLVNIFIRLIVDVYHNTPHAGLGGMTPRQAWLEMTRKHPVPPAPTGWLRRNIYGIPLQRKITKHGITFDDIQFQSPQIQAMRRDDKDQWVDVKIDRYSLEEISVIHGDAMYRVPAVMKGLRNVSIWQWKAAKERLRVSDRQYLEFTQSAVDDAIEWAAEQADVARAELELGTPVLSGETFEQLEAKMDRFIRIVGVSTEHVQAIRNQIAFRPELCRLFGMTSTLREKAEMTPALAKVLTPLPVPPQNAAAPEAKAVKVTRKAVLKAKPVTPPDDEFGMPN